MTAQRDPDQLVHAFLQEGPAELSPRLLAGIREGVHGTSQRAPWRPRRTLSMPRPILIFAILGALLLAAGAVLLVGPGGPRPATVVAPSPSASAIASRTPAVYPTPSVIPYPLVDGEAWIAYGNSEGGITLIRPDGTASHDIIDDLPVVAATLDWSPDGRRFAFEGNGSRGSQIWIVNADGTGARELTPTPDGCPSLDCTEGVQPSWSPDGQSVAYIAVTHESGTFNANSLAVVDAATGATSELYSTTADSLARPAWSRDGKAIALEIDHYSGAPEDSQMVSSAVGLVDVGGPDHTPREITAPALLGGYPDWHPTQDLIALRTNRYDGNTKTMLDNAVPSDLYTIHPDGSRLTRITRNKAGGVIVRAPTWTTDGRILYAKLADANADEELRVISPDGNGEASATGDVVTKAEGRWRPAT